VRGRGDTSAVLSTTAFAGELKGDEDVLREAGRVVGRTALKGQTVV
jgi:hypothetical protein